MRQAIAYAIDRKRVNEIASRGTAFEGHGLLPDYYKAFYEQPAEDYPLDVDRANQMLDEAGWERSDDGGVREKGGQRLSFDLFVRSESQSNIQAARLVREMTQPIGVDFKVQVVSVDKLTEITTREVDEQDGARTSTPSSGAGAAIPTTRACCSTSSPRRRSAGRRTRSTRTPSTTASTTSSRASSTRRSARRSSSR